VPIHFKIKTITEKEGAISPLYQFLFEHVDAKAMLKTIASEVVVTYLTRSDYFDFLGKNRVKAADDLKRLVQDEADRLNLGVEIVLIALEATHPPGEVAKSYDEVMAAEYERDKVVYEANVKSMNRISEANIMSGRIISDAKGKTALIEYNGEQVPMKKANAIERVKRLEVQLESFNAQPYLFSLINYLATIEDKMASTPKVIIDSSKTKTNFQIDLKPAILPDIGDLQEVLQREN
jgi:regulator of protease activity HflC (stomatin/prohibitin superfamily)